MWWIMSFCAVRSRHPRFLRAGGIFFAIDFLSKILSLAEASVIPEIFAISGKERLLRSFMAITLAFDVYGTLIDTQGVIVALEKHLGTSAPGFSRMWREKQLEYSFRRGLMQNYENFAECTRNA